MAIRRLDHTSIVVEDLEAAIGFFTDLGMELEGRAPIGGAWVDRVNALDGVDIEIAMMRTPDGSGRLELTTFRHPPVIRPEPPDALGNVLGLRSIMFAVDDLDAVVAGLRARDVRLVGNVEQWESYRLCYVRGPGGVIVALAEELG